MATFSHRLKVARIPEQPRIAPVWLDMIGHGGLCLFVPVARALAKRMSGQLGPSHPLPSCAFIPALDDLAVIARHGLSLVLGFNIIKYYVNLGLTNLDAKICQECHGPRH